MSHDLWSVVLLLGVVSWILSSVTFIFCTFPRKDEFVVTSAIRWGGASLLSFLVWIAGMLNA